MKTHNDRIRSLMNDWNNGTLDEDQWQLLLFVFHILDSDEWEDYADQDAGILKHIDVVTGGRWSFFAPPRVHALLSRVHEKSYHYPTGSGIFAQMGRKYPIIITKSGALRFAPTL